MATEIAVSSEVCKLFLKAEAEKIIVAECVRLKKNPREAARRSSKYSQKAWELFYMQNPGLDNKELKYSIARRIITFVE